MAGNGQACLSPHPAHVLRFSTDDVPEKDRLPYWREFFGRGVCGLDYELPAGAPFHSRAELLLLPDLCLLSGEISSAMQRRTRSLIAADGNDDLLLAFNPTAPSIATQHGREAMLTHGDATLLSAAEVGAVYFPQISRFTTLRIPLRRFKTVVPNIENQFGKRIPCDTPALRLLTGYVDAWRQGELAVTPEMGHVLPATCTILPRWYSARWATRRSRPRKAVYAPPA